MLCPGGVAQSTQNRRHGFEFHQGIRFLGSHSNAVVYKQLNMHCLCIEKREIKALARKYFLSNIMS
jgi:hypothetical protein